MSRIKGTVSKVGKSQYSYFIMLDEEQFYYNTKFEPKCKEGDVVGIEFAKKADNRGQIQKVTILTVGDGPANDFESKPSRPSGGRPAAGGDRQDSIVWQHSQEMALRATNIIIASGGFAIKGTADKKRIQIEGLVDELTARYFNDAMNPRQSEAFKTASEIDSDLDQSGDNSAASSFEDGETETDAEAWDKWDN